MVNRNGISRRYALWTWALNRLGRLFPGFEAGDDRQEAANHLGVETQRQWSDLAILRTTPALLGLFSLITVWADGLARDTTMALRPNAAAWYRKQEPTFSDAIAAVRRVLWCPPNFSMSRQIGEIIEIPTSLLNRVFQTLCLAA
jgi:hypothetical protein